jgi:glycosyltransferase involved in cell wall biosynthesis
VLKAIPALAGHLRRRRPFVLLATIDYANIAAIWARYLSLRPMRVAVRVAGPLTLDAQSATRRLRRWMPWFVRLFYPFADSIIAVSQGVAADLKQVIPYTAKKINVLYNPLMIDTIRSQAEMLPQLPDLISSDLPVILGLGRLSAEKDFFTLIKAFARVRETVPSRLIILGEGPERSKLETLVHDLGLERVIALPGYVTNPYAFLKRAALMVLPSIWEGSPNVLLEALACGCPVVSTNGPGGAAELLDQGRYGRLVAVGDVEALADAMLAVLRGQPFDLAATDEWLKKFDYQVIAEQYLDELRGR